ncbi:OLC1v1000973C1 [Oldenlandia corymbosa var. corymbosa]|uniref:OLC1v1000973C1 n=1 Tax=Oldenlandia corymbosa var. corymbosa TaxID=529605 RepID=A0AAV1D453_OLDCO|nr:OLC1v1000973C1 [Oldenlandia corymbosa var. corymbosa]
MDAYKLARISEDKNTVGCEIYFDENYVNSLDGSTTTTPKAAVKTAPVDRSSTLRREALFLHKLRGNPYIVEYYGEDVSFDENDDGYAYNLLMEYAPGGLLKELIASYEDIMPKALAACYAYMLLKAISFVQDNDIVHCDIKPENVPFFPTTNGYLDHLKLADFGVSKNVSDDIVGAWGTEEYLSPKSVKHEIQGKAADIWAFGCTVLEMLNGGKDILGLKEEEHEAGDT